MVVILALSGGCGLIEPEDGTLIIHGTIVGSLPEELEGIRIAVLYPNDYYPTNPISEALVWTDDSFRDGHQSRGNETTIKTTITLRPTSYILRLQEIWPPAETGGSWRYCYMGSESFRSIKVLPGKTVTARLRGEVGNAPDVIPPQLTE